MSEAQVQINLFGGFEVLFQGEPALLALQQSRKTDLFLEYLILKHGRPVPHEELLCALWTDRESRNPATALRTLLHRYRRLVEREALTPLEKSVVTTRGFYQWNIAAECVVDVYEFERLATEARELPVLDERRMALQRRMVELYRGPLLSSAAEQSWIVPKSVYYHDLYVECIYAMMDYWKAHEAYDEIISLCRHVLEIERFDSRLQMELAYARQKAGKASEEDASALSTDNPSLYQAIVRAEHSAEMDISRGRIGRRGWEQRRIPLRPHGICGRLPAPAEPARACGNDGVPVPHNARGRRGRACAGCANLQNADAAAHPYCRRTAPAGRRAVALQRQSARGIAAGGEL